MKKILILANSSGGLYAFRCELLKRLIEQGNEVYCSVPFLERIEELSELGCKCIETKISRRGVNPFEDFKLFLHYSKLLKKIKPDVVLCYTIKPNIYGGLACQSKRIPYVVNITGLGNAIENKGILQKIALFLYKMGLKKARKVFFQNSENQKFMTENGYVKVENELLPGSGVNIDRHCFEDYPAEREEIVLLTIGRLMKAKGTDEILSAAEILKKEYPNLIFRFIGRNDSNYDEKIKEAVDKGIIEFLGFQKDVHSFVKECDAVLHASYFEGMSNVLLETASSGRPVIASNIPGCRETFDNGVSGIAFKPRDVDDLVRAVKEFINLPYDKRVSMGKAGREKIEREFNREIIIEKYIDIINKITD